MSNQFMQLEQRLDDHIKTDAEWKEKHEQEHSQINETLSRTATLQEVNSKQLNQLTEDTAGVIQLHQDLKGTVRVGNSVQKFMVWLLKWGAIGTASYAGINMIIEFFSKGG